MQQSLLIISFVIILVLFILKIFRERPINEESDLSQLNETELFARAAIIARKKEMDLNEQYDYRVLTDFLAENPTYTEKKLTDTIQYITDSLIAKTPLDNFSHPAIVKMNNLRLLSLLDKASFTRIIPISYKNYNLEVATIYEDETHRFKFTLHLKSDQDPPFLKTFELSRTLVSAKL